MNSLKLVAFYLMGTFSFSALALNQGVFFHKQSLKAKIGTEKNITLRADNSPRIMETAFFDQKLDHSSPEDSTIFKQRYFVDSTYADDDSSPVFLIICGEWNCGGTGSYGYAEGLAKKMKAHLVALEHRYYGESLPMTTLTTENLKHLNLDAAVEDLANFQRAMMGQRNLSGKWISFGGSYAGTVAAFYRLKHPELVSGSLASSAPVLMKPDFFEYDAHIAKVISSSTCGQKVQEAIALIEAKLTTPEGEAELKTMFAATDINTQGDFLYAVADMLAAAVQYGRHKVFCDALLRSNDLIKGYAEGGLKVLSSLGLTPFDTSFQSAEKIEVTSDDYFRQWMWQSCKEFGWFQVANSNGTPARSSKLDLKFHADTCERLYQTDSTADGSLNTEWYLPLFNPETSNIIFSNGSNDPWETLSVIPGIEHSNSALSLYVMDGAAHCDDLRALPSLPSVIVAQQQMASTIEKWLKE